MTTGIIQSPALWTIGRGTSEDSSPRSKWLGFFLPSSLTSELDSSVTVELPLLYSKTWTRLSPTLA